MASKMFKNRVVVCLGLSVSLSLKKPFLLQDIIMLALDEICDGGVLLEADPAAVVSRVALRTDDIPLGEQTVAQVCLVFSFSFHGI